MVAIAQRHGMRIMGPNGIGVMDTHTPLNTTFVKGMPPKGSIAFLSQSGALCGGIIDWTIGRGIGFSRFLSVGNEADVNETDVIPFLAEDDATPGHHPLPRGRKGGPAFLDALRNAAAHKPVWRSRAGRTASGQAATASHTGALAGVHAAFRAACQQTGVIEVESVEAPLRRRAGTGLPAAARGATASPWSPMPAGRPRWPPTRSKAPGCAWRAPAPSPGRAAQLPHPRRPAGRAGRSARRRRTSAAIGRRWTAVLADPSATACWPSWCRRCW